MERFVYYSVCPICQSDKKSTIVTNKQLEYEHAFADRFFRKVFLPESPEYMFKDHIHFTHLYEADLVCCGHCGHISRNPRLSPDAARQEYSEDCYHPDWLDISYQPYCNSFLELMPRLIGEVGEHAEVLEIGSQVGGFLHAATAFGWKAKGVDVGKIMVDFSRAKGYDVYLGTVEEAGFDDESFDAVFVWLCFEMLPHPQRTLKEIYRILRPGGRLYISVPNGEFIRRIQPLIRLGKLGVLRETTLKVLAYDILAAFPFQFGYTPSSIRHLLCRGKFTNVKVSNQLYIPISSSRQLSAQAMIEKVRLLRITHLVAQSLFRFSLGRLIWGPWIEVVCQKP